MSEKAKNQESMSNDIPPVLKETMEFVKSLHPKRAHEDTGPSKYAVEDLPQNVKDFIKGIPRMTLFQQNGTRPHGEFEGRIISCEYNNKLDDAHNEACKELSTFKKESRAFRPEHTSFDDVSDMLRSGRRIMRSLLNENYPSDILKTAMTETANVAFQTALDVLKNKGYDTKSPEVQAIALDVVAVFALKTECLLAAASYLVFDGQPELVKFSDICMKILESGYCMVYNDKYEIFEYGETPKHPTNK